MAKTGKTEVIFMRVTPEHKAKVTKTASRFGVTEAQLARVAVDWFLQLDENEQADQLLEGQEALMAS